MPKRLTFAEVEEWVLINTESTLLSQDYRNSATKLLFRCKCGNEFSSTFGNFKSSANKACRKCAKIGRKKKTDSQFKEELLIKHSGLIYAIGEYKSALEYVKVGCSVCGHEWDSRASALSAMGQGCPVCGGTLRKTQEKFINDLETVHGDDISVLGNYIATASKIKVKCNKCLNEWNPVAASLLRGSGCPLCVSSKGEKEIENCLSSLKCLFQPQYRFKDCINQRQLPFDFAVLDDSDDPVLLIEYDGRQHFEAVEHWGGEATLQRTQQNDRIKTDYCKANCIPLLRISYKQQDQIEQLVNDAVQKYCPQEMAV